MRDDNGDDDYCVRIVSCHYTKWSFGSSARNAFLTLHSSFLFFGLWTVSRVKFASAYFTTMPFRFWWWDTRTPSIIANLLQRQPAGGGGEAKPTGPRISKSIWGWQVAYGGLCCAAGVLTDWLYCWQHKIRCYPLCINHTLYAPFLPHTVKSDFNIQPPIREPLEMSRSSCCSLESVHSVIRRSPK